MDVERERFISGEGILKRWKGAPFELVNAMLSGDLVAIDKRTSNRHNKNNDGCFFCCATLAEDAYTICFITDDEFEDGVHFAYTDPEDEKSYYLRYCHEIWPWKGQVTEEKRTNYRIEKAMRSDFLMAEVEAYEQAHGLGPLPHKPEKAEALAETLRAAGITDAGMIARMVKAAFPETTLPEIGALLVQDEKDPSKKKKSSNGEATIKRAQRALKSK